MKIRSKINNRSLFLLLIIFLSIFSMAGLLSIKDVHADETWREYRMANIERSLNENKARLRALGHRKEQYLRNNVTNVKGRIGRFSVLALRKTIKYNQDVAALDKQIAGAYSFWRANRPVAARKDREAWRNSEEFKALITKKSRRRGELNISYVKAIQKLENEILRGRDGVLDAMDREQDGLLWKQKKLLEELEFLKTHTDEEGKARRDRLVGLDFRISIIGKTVRYVNIGDTEEVELIISTGPMPLTLEVIAEDGVREVKTLTKSGRLKLPFHFTTVGNKTRLFILKDNSNPMRSSTANVLFIVQDNTAPAIQIDKTASSLNINKGGSVTYTYKVTNQGNDPLSGIKVVDDTCSNVMFITGGDTNNDGKLDLGEIWTYECSMTLNADTTNTVTAKATGSTGKQVSDQAAAAVSVSTGVPTDCPSPKVEVPHVVYISKSEAEEIITNNNLRFRVAEKEQSYRYKAGTILNQFPNPGECVDPNTEIKVKVSIAPPETPPGPFSAKFDCGDSFELSPNEILYPRICNVLVSGYNDSDEPVRVTVMYNNSILRVFPDDQSAQPYLMYPSTAGPHSGYYVFSINFSTTSTAPAGETSAVVTVRQGSSEVRFPLTILVLPPGQEPSSGTGIRPPAEVATGSVGDSPDAYCVWRYKSFGDRPECFNFVRAECDTPRYISSRYELVGSGMTRMESASRMAQLGSYHDDAYGCHTSTETDDGTDGTEQKPSTGQEDRTISAINITPGSVTLKIGNSQSFTAIAVYSDNSTEVASGAQWSGNEGVAGNTFIASAAGNFTITAKYQGISGSASITVEEPSVRSITVSPSTITIKVGEMVSFSALAQFDVGNPRDVTGEATWSPGTEFKGMEAGTYTIAAEYKGVSGTATVTVQDLYGDAKAALQSCGFEKARSLIDQIPDGPQKTELEREYQVSMELEDNLKAMVNQARNDYKSCNYDEALAILNKALSQAKCSKHIESIQNKITMAEKRKAYEETTKRLHEEAKSLYKRKDYDGALAKLQQAYNHTKCDRYKDSLSNMIATVRGKRESFPEEQVAALDCSHYGEAEAYWDESEKKAKCKCKSGYKPSGNTCVPTRETLVQNLDCRAYPNTYAAWDRKNNRAACFCINKNYKWRSDGKGCIPKSGGVIQQDPMCPAAVYAIKNKLRSGDNTGLTLLANNARSMGCTDPVIDQVLTGGTGGGGTSPQEQVARKDCSSHGGPEAVKAYWDKREKKAKCRCKTGYAPVGNQCKPTKETSRCQVYPETAPLIRGSNYSIVVRPYGPGTKCLAPGEVAAERNKPNVTGFRNLGTQCTKCPAGGFFPSKHLGVDKCVRCPRGKRYQDGCCH